MRLCIQLVRVVVILSLVAACGSPHAWPSQPSWHTGAAAFRGHEDLTRFAVDKFNAIDKFGMELPPVAEGEHAASSRHPMIRGNFETDFPTQAMFGFYRVDPKVNWHQDGRLQFIHGLRNFSGQKASSNLGTCLAVRGALVRAAAHALAYFRAGDEDAGLYWSGHGLHILQDSYSPAHAIRDGVQGREVREFCTYSVQFPGICFHTKLDVRDRIWRQDRLDCALNPEQRSWNCLTEFGQYAAEASLGFLVAIQRSRAEGPAADAMLETSFSHFLQCDESFGGRD